MWCWYWTLWYWALLTSATGTGHCAQVVLADLAKVDDIHWKMLTAARVETPEEEAIFSTMVCHHVWGPFIYYVIHFQGLSILILIRILKMGIRMVGAGGADTERGVDEERGETRSAEIWFEIN